LSSCRQQKSWELELGNSGHYCQSQDPKPEVSWQADRANLVSIFQPFPFYIQTPQKSGGKIYKSLEKQQQITQAGMLSISYLD